MNDEQLNAAIELVRVANEVNEQGRFDAIVRLSNSNLSMHVFIVGKRGQGKLPVFLEGFSPNGSDCDFYPSFMKTAQLVAMIKKLRTLLIEEDAAA